jgi:hypothetical protein
MAMGVFASMLFLDARLGAGRCGGTGGACRSRTPKIVCDGKAKRRNGHVRLHAERGGGEEIASRPEEMDRDDVCRDVAKEFSVALGGLPFKVERYDPDKSRSRQDGAKFSLSLGGQTATGVTFERLAAGWRLARAARREMIRASRYNRRDQPRGVESASSDELGRSRPGEFA